MSKLSVSVFVCGAVVMIFELAGSRLMAPYFGTSIYVWTGIIGVILGSLSLGYWLGGRLADRQATAATYSWIIFFSGLAIYWTYWTKGSVPALFGNRLMPVGLGSLLAALFLFAPASVLLGLVSPYAVRLKMSSLEKSASTVGNLYAISTVGSIIGTFGAGYFLIPFLGVSNLVFSLSATLLILSLFFSKKKLGLKIAVLVVLTGSFFLLNATERQNERRTQRVNIDSQYNHIGIYPDIHAGDRRPMLSMSFDPFARQAAMFTDGDDLVWDYTKFYRLAKHFNPGLKMSLMIGGGAYSYPKDYLKEYPEARLDVVEIDPAVTAAAKKYFKLQDDPRLVTYDEDARIFLNRCQDRYDAIFDDAFGSALSIPFQLSTEEAIRRQYDILNDGGVVIANTASSINGVNGRFFRAEYATFKAVFPQVYVFPVSDANDPNRLQNLMIVALKSTKSVVMESADPELNGYLQHLWSQPVASDLPILTDDFAPVEYYMSKVI